MKTKRIWIRIHRYIAKARSFQSRGERGRIDRNTRIVPVDDPHAESVKAEAVDTGEDASGLQHTPYFAKEFVLQFGGIHVVQHMQTDGSGKLSIVEWHGGGITVDDRDVGLLGTGSQRRGQHRINFQRGNMFDFLA